VENGVKFSAPSASFARDPVIAADGGDDETKRVAGRRREEVRESVTAVIFNNLAGNE
jgi:hypothetical protein